MVVRDDVAHPRPHGVPAWAFEALAAASMTVGRGPVARLVAEMAGVSPEDEVVDVGCGPGAAAREAVRRGARATGVDPSATMLRVARWLSAARGQPVDLVDGSAEAIPLPDRSATVVWSVSSVHHWHDRDRGLAEVSRILRAGGRLVVVERSGGTGRGHLARHSLTPEQVDELAAGVTAAGFVDVAQGLRTAGRRTLAVVSARSPSTADPQSSST